MLNKSGFGSTSMSQSLPQQMDADDPLRLVRGQFILPPGEIYLDGNSLGPLLIAVQERLQHTIDTQWGQGLIRSWNESWIELPQRVARKLAPVVGASPADLICADSVSINLFKILSASLSLSPERTTILSLTDMFPTDLYIADGLSALAGADRCRLKLIEYAELDAVLNSQLGSQINVLMMSQVNFRTGEAYDLPRITQLAHLAGVRVLWDLSHSAGVLPVNLVENKIDFAVGCGYKFLNGGPGAPAFLYVNHELQPKLNQPLSGWMGHRAPFEFSPQYEPAPGMDQFLSGTPGILSMSALDAALELWEHIALDAVFEKSQKLTQLFIESVNQAPALNDFNLIKVPVRGSQVSLAHGDAFAISQALIDRGIICDFRAPNLVRFGFSPLYNRYQDILTTVQVLSEIMVSKCFQQAQYQQSGKVT